MSVSPRVRQVAVQLPGDVPPRVRQVAVTVLVLLQLLLPSPDQPRPGLGDVPPCVHQVASEEEIT